MKKVILVMALIFCAKPAFAMHAYATDTCVAQTLAGRTLTIALSNDTPASPHELVLDENSSLKSEKNLWVNMDQSKDSFDEGVSTSSLVLKGGKELTLSTKKINDGCFEGEGSTTVRGAKVLAVSKAVAKEFGLIVGQTLSLSCYVDFQAPTGKSCH